MRKSPWDSNSKFDWKLIKKRWDKLANKNNKKTFIEASPPNIMRVPEILEIFTDSRIVFSISSPYSYVASCMFNYGISEYFIEDFNAFTDECIRKLTKEWADKAKQQIKNIKMTDSEERLIKYEDFCADPNIVLEKLNITSEIKSTSKLAIQGKKNSKVGTIRDMTAKHLSFLGIKGILKINQLLEKSSDTMEYFQYNFLAPQEYRKALSKHLLLTLGGYERKRKLKNQHRQIKK